MPVTQSGADLWYLRLLRYQPTSPFIWLSTLIVVGRVSRAVSYPIVESVLGDKEPILDHRVAVAIS